VHLLLSAMLQPRATAAQLPATRLCQSCFSTAAIDRQTDGHPTNTQTLAVPTSNKTLKI